MFELVQVVSIIVIIILLLGIIIPYITFNKKKQRNYIEPDYRTFFILGICFLPIGIIFMITVNPGFMRIFASGIIYMSIGLTNQDNRRKYRSKFIIIKINSYKV